MQADRFTIKSQEALVAAARLAQERRNPQVVAARGHKLVIFDGDGVFVDSEVTSNGVAHPSGLADHAR